LAILSIISIRQSQNILIRIQIIKSTGEDWRAALFNEIGSGALETPMRKIMAPKQTTNLSKSV